MGAGGEVRGPSPVGKALELAQTLRTGDALFGQGLRFALAGGVVTLVYLTTTTVLSTIAGVPFQVALGVGFCAAIAVHFTLQRMFVWTHQEFALPLHHQVGRYLVVACGQYGVTVLSTSLLPSALGVPTETVYLATVLLTVTANFLVFRHGIFHADPGEPDPEGPVRARGSGETPADS